MNKNKTLIAALAVLTGLLLIAPPAYSAEASDVNACSALTAAESCAAGCASICKCPETGVCNCETCKCEDCSCESCSPGNAGFALAAKDCGCSDCGSEQGKCAANGCGDCTGQTCKGEACNTECGGAASCH